jgi:Transposase DDE domain group 1
LLAKWRSRGRGRGERQGRPPLSRLLHFSWSTLDSWSRVRRVVGKAKWTGGDANLRFVITSLEPAEVEARHLYEAIYCARRDRGSH